MIFICDKCQRARYCHHRADSFNPRNRLWRENMSHKECKDGSKRRNHRSIYRAGLRGAPQQHIEPAVDDYQRHDKYRSKVLNCNLIGARREYRKGYKAYRPDHHLKHKYLLKSYTTLHKRHIKREVNAEQQIRHNQRNIILQLSHAAVVAIITPTKRV